MFHKVIPLCLVHVDLCQSISSNLLTHPIRYAATLTVGGVHIERLRAVMSKYIRVIRFEHVTHVNEDEAGKKW